MIWLSVAVFVIVGIVLIVWRKELVPIHEIFATNRIHPGCLVAEGIFFLLLALVFYLLHRAGMLY